MLPHPWIASVFGVLFFIERAAAQTVVNSTYGGGCQQTYSDPNCWMPAEVPANTAGRQYNVTIPDQATIFVDVSATVSNLNLTGYAYFPDRTFTVVGTTAIPVDDFFHVIITSDGTAPSLFDAGTLSTFSRNTLRGKNSISSDGSPAALQFKGADVVSLGEGELSLYGALARVVDEHGSDALRNLARIESGAVLSLNNHNLAVYTPFTNNGTLHLGGNNATIFTAAYSLTNFDSGTRTLSGGTFVLDQFTGEQGNLPVELRFDAADIVNNGSTIQLGGATSRIADLAGNDGLRNLARILPDGSLSLRDRDFVTAGRFGNEGLLSLAQSTFIVAGPFTSFDSVTRALTSAPMK